MSLFKRKKRAPETAQNPDPKPREGSPNPVVTERTKFRFNEVRGEYEQRGEK